MSTITAGKMSSLKDKLQAVAEAKKAVELAEEAAAIAAEEAKKNKKRKVK